jgi:VanZ family protein
MRVIIALLFSVLIFILTCTENVHEFILHQQLHFQWNQDPDFRTFFNLTDYPFDTPIYQSQKIGHGMFFFIFSFLLNRVTTNVYYVISIAIPYAFMTEIAQLFFARTGCLLDVLYDSIGVLSYCFITFILSKSDYYQREM